MVRKGLDLVPLLLSDPFSATYHGCALAESGNKKKMTETIFLNWIISGSLPVFVKLVIFQLNFLCYAYQPLS
jgi:hypothetical protein